MGETSATESLFDGGSYKLAALRSADERHAIAQLDVAIEALHRASLRVGPLTQGLIDARELVLDRMVDLSGRIELRDEAHENAEALAEAVRRVVA